LNWGEFAPLEGVQIHEPKPLVRRVEEADLQKLASRFTPANGEPGAALVKAAAAKRAASAKPDTAAKPAAPAKPEAAPPAEIGIEAFAQVDLRAGKVLACERVPKADKLLKLTIDLGEPAPRTVVSGVAKAYAPEELVGKTVCVVANLAPREMRGVVSHGMVLFATGGERGLTAVELPADVAPGSRVK
jgi:methionyl-tRNA synthetase